MWKWIGSCAICMGALAGMVLAACSDSAGPQNETTFGPHFDLHFYTITTAQRDAITPADPAFEDKIARAPEPALIPESYVAAPDAIPRMGRHWVSTLAPEMNGQPFSRTLLYGFYDGEQVFLEPMVTRAFLETRQNVTEAIGLPAAYSKPGFYPRSYAVAHDAPAAEYRIVLRDFVRHD